MSAAATQSVRVCCRVRPYNKVEKEHNSDKSIAVSFDGTETICVVKTKDYELETGVQEKETADGKVRFNFDYVFPMDTSQSECYNQTAAPFVDEILRGYNCTVFAYGQTGSGKTHTMMGYSEAGIAEAAANAPQPSSASSSSLSLLGSDEKDPDPVEDSKQVEAKLSAWTKESEMGIIPRLVKNIFSGIRRSDPSLEFTVQVSYVEIYLEKVRDLLNPVNDNLKIRESKSKGVWIEEVTEIYVSSFDEVLAIMRKGESNRSVAATKMNAKSSRSHSVFILTVTQRNQQTNAKKSSKLVMVDLAGSEKVAKTGAAGLTLLQAQHTNKSLSALGNVINALTENRPHVPYRDSKLTRLLTDSLGGNSKTCLIITCSPSLYNVDETFSTLRFGARAKRIQNKPRVNQERTVAEYKILLAEAKQIITEQQMVIAAMEKDIAGLVKVAEGAGVNVSQLTAMMTHKDARRHAAALPALDKDEDADSELIAIRRSAQAAAASASAPQPPSSAAASTTGADSEPQSPIDRSASPESPSSWAPSTSSLITAVNADAGGAAASLVQSSIVEELKAKLVQQQGELMTLAETVDDLRDALSQRDSELDAKDQELLQLKTELGEALNKLKKTDLLVLELKENLARHVLDKKTSELNLVANTLQISELQADNTDLSSRNARLKKRLAKVFASLQSADPSRAAALAVDEEDLLDDGSDCGSPRDGDEPKKASRPGSAPTDAADGDAGPRPRVPALALSRAKADSSADLFDSARDIPTPHPVPPSEPAPAGTPAATVERLTKDYNAKCEEVIRLQLQLEEAEFQVAQLKGTKPLATGSQGSTRSLTDKQIDAGSYEKLKQDFHRKCDQNLRLKMKLDDLKFQADFEKDSRRKDQKQLEALKAENARLKKDREKAGEPELTVPEPEDGKMDSQTTKLRALVEKLRSRNDALKRSEEYQTKLLQNKAEHIEVLEVALKESNALHREQTKKHNVKVQSLEQQVAALQKQLEQSQASTAATAPADPSAQSAALPQSAAPPARPPSPRGAQIVKPIVPQNSKKSWFPWAKN